MSSRNVGTTHELGRTDPLLYRSMAMCLPTAPQPRTTILLMFASLSFPCFVPSQFDPRRTRVRYTGQDIATMIAAYAAVWISATAWYTEMSNQTTRHVYVLQG